MGTSISDNEQKALKSLLDSFASVLSLEDIASAYCKAGRDAAVAFEILSQMQGSLSTSLICSSGSEAKIEESSDSSFDDPLAKSRLGNEKSKAGKQRCSIVSEGYFSIVAKSEESSESSFDELLEKSSLANGKSKTTKQRWRPVTAGSVSSVIGRDYMRSPPPSNGSSMAVKPPKVDIKELSRGELDDDMHKDMEDFLFKVLGEEFQLGRAVIRSILEECGYDMAKSMDRLLNLSAATLTQQKSNSGSHLQEFIASSPEAELLSSQRNIHHLDNSRGHLNANGKESYEKKKEIEDIEKEVLTSLFNASEKYEESSRPVRPLRRSMAIGEVVVEPPEDPTVKCNTSVTCPQEDSEDDTDKEDSYQQLRRAVAEYRATMEEYYKAAATAFAEGKNDQANKLLEQGQFFYKKAREADEESSQKIFETRKKATSDDVLLDLHDQGVKESVKLLKSHLSSFAGIPSFKYLKVIIEKNGEDVSKGARRRLVTKLLERESIEWAEDEDPGTIVIDLERINPKRLIFAKK